jgi:hypothetical protein
MAQVYNHIIMPLANRRDKITQIRWGIADFEHRFGRKPEGMWLAETAVDGETLDLLAQHGMKFVVLSPRQCKQVRTLPAGTSRIPVETEWQPVTEQTLDTRVAYQVPLEEGRSIAAFFYDGNISQAVAFEGLLSSGDKFATRLLGGFLFGQPGAQLVHIATDGESYGHHHRHGEMALSHALDIVEQQGARLTIYGEYLELAAPRHQAEVHDATAWSCFHGVERWRSDCGCSSNIAGWNQRWRTPLRDALDWLRDSVAPLCEQLAATVVATKGTDADLNASEAGDDQASAAETFWRARDAYIAVILDRSPRQVDSFLAEYLRHETREQDQTTLLQLMELQRHALLMFTSCGWFFDDISGIETVQILTYAGRVLQLAATLFGEPAAGLEAGFMQRLGDARSNVPAQGDGASLYRTQVRRQFVDLEKVCAHYAIRSLFEESHTGEASRVFAYEVVRQQHELHASGRARLLMGRARIASALTREHKTCEYAVLHFGDQNLTAAVRPVAAEKTTEAVALERFVSAGRKAFLLGDLPEVVRLMDSALGVSKYSLQSLFEDEQRRILALLLARTLQDVEAGLRGIHAQHTSLLHFLESAKLPQPAALRFVAEFVTTANLYQALEREPIHKEEVQALLHTIAAEQLAVDTEKLRFMATDRGKRALVALQLAFTRQGPEDAAIALERAIAVVETLRLLPVDLNLWQAQNLWHQIWLEQKPRPVRKRRRADDPVSDATSELALDKNWMQRLRLLGGLLDLAVDEFRVEGPAA